MPSKLTLNRNAIRFVDRYIPGYVFFGDIPPPFRLADQPRWIGKSLAMIIDDHMTLVKAVEF